MISSDLKIHSFHEKLFIQFVASDRKLRHFTGSYEKSVISSETLSILRMTCMGLIKKAFPNPNDEKGFNFNFC